MDAVSLLGGPDEDPLFEVLARGLPQGVLLLEDGEVIRYASDAACRLLDAPAGRLLARRLSVLVGPPDETTVADQPDRDGSSPTEAMRVAGRVRRDGIEVTVALSPQSVTFGGKPHTLALLTDTTERTRMSQAFAEHRETFHCIVEQINAGVLLLDADGVITLANPAAEKIMNCHAELVGTEFGIPVGGSDRSEMQVIRRDGAIRYVEVIVTRTDWLSDQTHLVVLHDVTPYREAQQQIARLSFRDTLTALPNRPALVEDLGKTLKRAQRDSHRFGVVHFDLKQFQDVNESLGHAVGDQVLTEVARRLSGAVRDTDLVARIGGDEFVVVLDHLNGADDTPLVAQKLLDVLTEPTRVGPHELFLKAHVGCVQVGPCAGDTKALELLRKADTAMHQAKRTGVPLVVYDARMGADAQAQVCLVTELHHAIDAGEFCLFYQPQVDLQTGDTVSYEALIRWQHPTRGLVPPNEFIPPAERSGLICDIGHWVIDTACQQLSHWRSIGSTHLRPVSINVSPIQLQHDDMAGSVLSALDKHDVPVHLLKVELTESALLTRDRRVVRQLQALADAGVALHMDDFGTGYSCLGLIKQMPFDTIKLDRSFIRGLPASREDLALTSATVTMARGLGRSVIAEGVETEDQVQALKALGCPLAQGYLFGRPAPAPDAVPALAS